MRLLRRQMLSMLALTACGPSGKYIWVQDLPPAPVTAGPSTLRPGDRLQVQVLGHDTIGGELEVRPEGAVVIPQVGQVVARGLTLEQLRVNVTQRLSVVLQNPQVSIVLVSRRLAFVSVLGEVTTPGRYELRDREGVLDALARAGGFTQFADQDRIFVLSRARGGQRVRFRYEDLTRGEPSAVAFELQDADVLVVE